MIQLREGECKVACVTDLDRRIFFALYPCDGHRPLVFSVMIALTCIGSGWSMLGLLPMLVIARTRPFALALLATLLSTAAGVFIIKNVTRRPRPSFALEGVHALFGSPTDYSFPSGHAAGSFALAAFVSTVALTTMGRRRNVTRIAITFLVFALASGIAVSRVYLGWHFPSDVLGGAIVGTMVGVMGGRWYVARAGA